MDRWILCVFVSLGMSTALRLGLEAIIGLVTLVQRRRQRNLGQSVGR